MIENLKVRDAKNAKIKFNDLKQNNNLNLKDLKEIIEHNDTDIDIIISYLQILQKNDKKEYYDDLAIFYQILPKEICYKFNINKKLSEKERFYDIYNRITESYDISNVDNIIKEEFNFPEELKNIDYYKNKDIKRWDVFYNQMIDIKTIQNKELLYYKLSNRILNNFKNIKSKEDKESILKSLDLFTNCIELIKDKEEKYSEIFEFICFAILNCENINNGLFNDNFKAIYFELNGKKSLNKNKIIDCFKKKGFNVTFNENKMKIFLKKKFVLEINDYTKYNINENMINSINDQNSLYIAFNNNYNFYELIKPEHYFNGYLKKLIDNYVKSNLSKTAIKKCFNLIDGKYTKLEKELFTEEINKYIIYIPYNSKKDTGRTMKEFPKIIIDPIKNKFSPSVEKKIDSNKLIILLEQFCNTTCRKHIFEHEHHHLCQILLFYFYINENYTINTPKKEIKDNSVILSKEKVDSNNKKIISESGDLFEEIAYGKVKKVFYLKELLFIANEVNDELDIDNYRKKFMELKDQTTDDLLKNFPKNQVMSDLVEKIYEGFLSLLNESEYKNKTIEDVIGNVFVCKNDDDKSETIKSIEEIDDIPMVEEIYHYNNHIPARAIRDIWSWAKK